jgi:hypothetical protein
MNVLTSMCRNRGNPPMATVEIYFCGFICHVGSSEEEGSERNTLVRSLLIADGDNHIPRVLISAGAAGADDDNRARKRQAAGSRKSEAELADLGVTLTTDVSFSHLGFVAKADPLYRDCVPHLDDLTRAGTKFHPDPPGLWVTLPAGTITIVEFYDEGAKWTLDGDVDERPCVPRVTMLTASGDSPGITFNNKTLPLSDGWILITNLETTAASGAVGAHWTKQHTVTTGAPNDVAVYESLSDPAKWLCPRRPSSGSHLAVVLGILGGTVRLIDSSECTNSHWP